MLRGFSQINIDEACSLILIFILLKYEYIYTVTYNRYMQLVIGSAIRLYYGVVWFFTIISLFIFDIVNLCQKLMMGETEGLFLLSR